VLNVYDDGSYHNRANDDGAKHDGANDDGANAVT
jgi:hypothetical protein